LNGPYQLISNKRKINLSAAALITLTLFPVSQTFALTDSEITSAVRKKSGPWMVSELKGRKLTETKHYEEAAKIFTEVMAERKALALDLQTEQLALAEIYEKWQKPAQAEAMYKQAIADREQTAGDESQTLVYCLQSYSDFLSRQKNVAAAAVQKKRIIYINSQATKPPKELTALLKSDTPALEKAASAVKIGQLYLKRDEERRAMHCFNKAIALDPKNSDAYEGRGEVFNRIEKESMARLDFDKAIALNPKNAQALFHRALHLRVKNNENAALADFNQALAAAPNDTEILGYRAKLQQDLHHNELAIKDYSHVLELDKNAEWARCQRGLCYQDMKQFDKALADFAELAQKYPDDSNYSELKTKAELKAKAEKATTHK
jgi:tetratricopeptide (TPR) repeat protein